VKSFLTARSRAVASSRHLPEAVRFATPRTFQVLTKRPTSCPEDAEMSARSAAPLSGPTVGAAERKPLRRSRPASSLSPSAACVAHRRNGAAAMTDGLMRMCSHIS